MDPSGHARIVGRIKDMIIRGGENIYPREVEEYLNTHPKIIEPHVFGVPDKRLGEAVAVWIRLKDGETMTVEEVKAFCKGQVIKSVAWTLFFLLTHVLNIPADFTLQDSAVYSLHL